MRSMLPIIGTLSLWTSVCSGQECAVPQPTCAPSVCAPTPKVGTTPKTTNERFVRGPVPGSAAGESNSLGIRGPTLHIPEIRITLPHLELPSLFHVRHDASKIFGITQSPLVDEPALELNNVGEAKPDVSSPSPEVSAPKCHQPCVPYCPPACAAPNQCASLDEQLRELNQKLARLEALEAQITQLKEEQRSMVGVTMASAVVENGAKPPVSQGSTVKPSRPVLRPQPSKYQTASYEEPADPAQVRRTSPAQPRQAANTTRQDRGRFGLSTPDSSTTSKPNFGDWTQKK